MSLITVYLVFLYIMTSIYFVVFLTQIFKKNSLSIIFAAFSFASSIYLFGVSGQIRSNSYIEIVFFQKFKYLGAPYIAPIFLLFIYRFKNYKLPKRRNILLLFLIPITITFLVNTNETHWLFYDSTSLINVDGYVLLITERGPLYALTYYNFLIFGIIVYYMVALARQKNRRLNYFLISIFLSVISIFILILMYNFRFVPHGIDLVPLTTIIQLISFYIAIVKLKIFDVYEAELEIVPKLSEGVIFIDDENTLIHFNLAASKIFNFLDRSKIGTNLSLIEEAKPLFSSLEDEKIIKYDNKRYKITISRAYGKAFIINDYTEQYNTSKQLKWMAEHDGLTDIYNQVYALKKLEERYNKAKINNEEFNIIMMDINNFKDINDKYGHLVGNQVLVSIGNVLRNVIGYQENTMFGRFGGDEFIVSFNIISKDEVILYSRKLIEEISKIEIKENLDEKIKVSIGLANMNEVCTTKESDYMTLIDKADIAMYKSKKQGDNIITSYYK